MAIQLRFCNYSQLQHTPDIVIFQKPVNAGWNGSAVAWLLIQHCGLDEFHPFSFPQAVVASLSRSENGGFLGERVAEGETIGLHHDVITQATTRGAGQSNTIDVCNDALDESAVLRVKRDGRLLAMHELAPHQRAMLRFEPVLWVGVAPPGVRQGDLITPDMYAGITASFPLAHMSSAEITMRGGANGDDPVVFALENVQGL